MSEPLIQENFRVESITVKVSDPNNPENKIKTYLDKDSVSQFEYREGLLDKFLKVTLQIADSNSALSDKLVGMEQFEIVVHDLAHDVKYEFTEESTNGPLYVFQIHDKIIVDSVKILVLELCRKDAIEGMQIRVCKKYTSVKAEELLEDILKNVLNTKKPYTNVSKSSNTLTFIPPNSRPYDVLFWSRISILLVIKKVQQLVVDMLVLGTCFGKPMINIILNLLTHLQVKLKKSKYILLELVLAETMSTTRLETLVSPNHLI